jgi:hypothetical protein
MYLNGYSRLEARQYLENKTIDIAAKLRHVAGVDEQDVVRAELLENTGAYVLKFAFHDRYWIL